MSELKNIWDELERGKANKNRNGKWGFTVYRTDWEDQRLWREYLKYLRSTVESTIDLDKDKPVVDNPDQMIEEEDKNTKAQKKIRRRIRANFELVVVQDRLLEGYSTAQVRRHHRQQIEAHFDGETPRPSADPHKYPVKVKQETGERGVTPPLCLLTPQEEEEEEECEGEEETHDKENNHDHDEANNKPKPQKRPPREEKRVGHVWQDYLLHVNGDVLKRYARACHQEARLSNWPALYPCHRHHAPYIAIVAEAERSDYRLRRFGAWAGDGGVPELQMEWQYVEITSLPALYDHLSRLPLGRAQLFADPAFGCRRDPGGGVGVLGAKRGLVRELLYGRAHAAIEVEDHGPWYEGFCFPPTVNTM